jgi:hypothetical protein
VFVGAENGFYVTSTIVSGARDAVVIDAQFTRSDARRLARIIHHEGTEAQRNQRSTFPPCLRAFVVNSIDWLVMNPGWGFTGRSAVVQPRAHSRVAQNN